MHLLASQEFNIISVQKITEVSKNQIHIILSLSIMCTKFFKIHIRTNEYFLINMWSVVLAQLISCIIFFTWT